NLWRVGPPQPDRRRGLELLGEYLELFCRHRPAGKPFVDRGAAKPPGLPLSPLHRALQLLVVRTGLRFSWGRRGGQLHDRGRRIPRERTNRFGHPDDAARLTTALVVSARVA